MESPRRPGRQEKKRILASRVERSKHGGGRRGGYEKRGRGLREKFHERLTASWDTERKNRREIRDKETDTDNEKTSTAKEETGRWLERTREKQKERWAGEQKEMERDRKSVV